MRPLLLKIISCSLFLCQLEQKPLTIRVAITDREKNCKSLVSGGVSGGGGGRGGGGSKSESGRGGGG